MDEIELKRLTARALTCEVCDHGLEVEEGLEAALGDLRLKSTEQKRK